jgi:hypothetical protein
MAQAIVATITDIARSKFADMLASGRAFTVTSFVTGEGGHDTGDPAVALTPDPTLLSLPLQSFGPKAVTIKTLITPYCVQYTCDLSNLEAVGALSNIGLIAEVTYSPILADPLVGTTFLFSIGNFPLQIKTDAETKQLLISVQY